MQEMKAFISFILHLGLHFLSFWPFRPSFGSFWPFGPTTIATIAPTATAPTATATASAATATTTIIITSRAGQAGGGSFQKKHL